MSSPGDVPDPAGDAGGRPRQASRQAAQGDRARSPGAWCAPRAGRSHQAQGSAVPGHDEQLTTCAVQPGGSQQGEEVGVVLLLAGTSRGFMGC